MLDRIRRHLSYANVMATLAVFIALGGSSYAAYTISGSKIKDRSIRGGKLRHNTLTGRQIRESRLARVPRAREADWANDAEHVGGQSLEQLKVRCPEDTYPIADVCVERTTRPPGSYCSAALHARTSACPRGRGGGCRRIWS